MIKEDVLRMSQTSIREFSKCDDPTFWDTLNIRILDKECSCAICGLCSDELLVFTLLISVFGDLQSACLCCGNSLKCNLNTLAESVVSAAQHYSISHIQTAWLCMLHITVLS